MTYDFDGPEATPLQRRRSEAQYIAPMRWYLTTANAAHKGLVFVKTAHPYRNPGGMDNPIPLEVKAVTEVMRHFREAHFPFGIRIEL